MGYTLCGQLFGMPPIALASLAVLLLGCYGTILHSKDIPSCRPGLPLSTLRGRCCYHLGLWVNAIIRESRNQGDRFGRSDNMTWRLPSGNGISKAAAGA
jgi:hypothetical protein